MASCLRILILFIVKDTLWLCTIRFLTKLNLLTPKGFSSITFDRDKI